ncbi:hypothetical protein [Streptomyces sp. NPDC001816]|uniref:hypothetical protein n=1 Tax=Streptomyces sp. NPDC001816 TaxID=3364612 RepID=UPI0036A3B4EA
MDRELAVATELAEWASERIRRPRATGDVSDVREKATPADIVTDTDEAVEAHVRAVLCREFPEYASRARSTASTRVRRGRRTG